MLIFRKMKEVMMEQQHITQQRIQNLKKLSLSSMFIALGILLPFLAFGNPEFASIWLPMHIPVLIAGFILGAKHGLLVGILTPLLRSLLFGMPPLIPIAIIMSFELGTYGMIAGLAFNLFKKNNIRVYLTLLSSMVLGRVIWGISAFLIFQLIGRTMTLQLFIESAFVIALPGIIFQIVFIPLFILYLERTGIIRQLNMNENYA
jgi:riboflavin transporter FmnP